MATNYETLHCIALRTVRYTDRHSILTVYTRERGRRSLLVPAGNGRTAARYRALTMPMAAFECVAMTAPGKEIYPFKDLKADAAALGDGGANPVRNVVAMFLADFFYSLLKEPLPDEAMFRLLEQAARHTARRPRQELANLHIAVMVTAARVAGIEPDVSTASHGTFFDMAEGVWHRDIAAAAGGGTAAMLDRRGSAAAAMLARMTLDNCHRFRFSRKERNEVTDMVLKYFKLHGFGKGELTSTDVLREIF